MFLFCVRLFFFHSIYCIACEGTSVTAKLFLFSSTEKLEGKPQRYKFESCLKLHVIYCDVYGAVHDWELWWCCSPGRNFRIYIFINSTRLCVICWRVFHHFLNLHFSSVERNLNFKFHYNKTTEETQKFSRWKAPVISIWSKPFIAILVSTWRKESLLGVFDVAVADANIKNSAFVEIDSLRFWWGFFSEVWDEL